MVSQSENNWIVQKFENCRYPFLLIDNWYTPDELKDIYIELDFFQSQKNKLRAAETVVAKNERTGESLSESDRYYVDTFYQKREISPILRCTQKQTKKVFHNLMEGMKPYARSFFASNRHSSMVSYYESKDYYKPHFDTFQWTCLIWIFKEPKAFEGGDLKLKEPEVEIKVKNNRMVFFPSCYIHEVTPLKMIEKKPGYGRYCITHFYYSVPGKFDNNYNFVQN